MPLWDPYADLLETDIADLGNAGSSPFAGTITAALFLKRFVPENTPWAHLDTFAWRPSAKPGRPKGGAALGLRAAWRSEEHTSELQSLMRVAYAVFCLKKKHTPTLQTSPS